MKDLFNLFGSKNQLLVLWKIKPSIIRVLTGVMEAEKVPFKLCSNDDELENILDRKLTKKDT